MGARRWRTACSGAPVSRWDERGEVAVAQAIYPQDQRVELVLGRDLEGAAVVHGGYGKAPATVPADMERLLPMLGFWGAAIE